VIQPIQSLPNRYTRNKKGERKVERTWKPTAAGILCIIAGNIGIIGGILFTLTFLVLLGDPSIEGEKSIGAPIITFWILGGIAIIVAIVGGINALRRRIWGLALAGSICALVGFVIPGILAIIFVILGKREFKYDARVAKELMGNISPKSRRATTLLAFFLGIFGAHRFYINKTRTAIVMLLLSIAGLAITGWAITRGGVDFLEASFVFYIFITLAAVGIWAFVDFIFAVTGYMKDREGRLIKNW